MSQGLSTDVDELPDISNLAIEDDAFVDHLISEKQQRLLTESLYSSDAVLGERLFLVAAKVVPTGTEQADQEHQRTKRLAEHLRSLDINLEA